MKLFGDNRENIFHRNLLNEPDFFVSGEQENNLKHEFELRNQQQVFVCANLLGALEGVIVARHVGHDGSFVRLGCIDQIFTISPKEFKKKCSKIVFKDRKKIFCFKKCRRVESAAGNSPSGSNMRGMSKYFSATSNAVFKFSNGLSFDNLE